MKSGGASRLMGSWTSVIAMAALSVSLAAPAAADISHASFGVLPSYAAMPDAAMPDAAMPDAAMPDAAMPDAAMPDAAMPDAAMPDIAQTPAVAESAIAVGQSKFEDVDSGVHVPAITALHDLGVLDGTECDKSKSLFCPSAALTRKVMAVWLVRILENAEPPMVEASSYEDVGADFEAPFIERLAQLEITVGCTAEPPLFCPDKPVTRMQMATFLVRAFKLPPAASMGFVDVGAGVHKPAVDGLAALNITAGCDLAPLRYCSTRAITRAEMATFLARTLGLVDLPDETLPVYASVSVGGSHTCGLRTDGTVTCWGINDKRQADAPAQAFVSVSAGGEHSCGVLVVAKERSIVQGDGVVVQGDGVAPVSGPVVCWGANSEGQTDAPEGAFMSVSAGGTHSCGVRVGGAVVCWGADSDGRTVAPQGLFSVVAAGNQHSCGVRVATRERTDHAIGMAPVSGPVVCWGANYKGQRNAPGGYFKAISVGHSHSCGLRVDETIRCWGSNENNRASAPSGKFRSVSSGEAHSCGVYANGNIACWGFNDDGRAIAPSGDFLAVSVGRSIPAVCDPITMFSAGVSTAKRSQSRPRVNSCRFPLVERIRAVCASAGTLSAGATIDMARLTPRRVNSCRFPLV